MKKNPLKFFLLFLLFSLSAAFLSCNFNSDALSGSENNVNARFAGLKNLTTSTASEDSAAAGLSTLSGTYQVLIITDVHVGASFYSDSTTQKFYSWLSDYVRKNSDQIKFCLSLGDFADSAKESQMKGYGEIVSRIESTTGVKVFNVIGNHDLYADDGFDIWEKYCYPHTSYYRFETDGLVWYGLDSGSGLLGSKQREDFIQKIGAETKTPVVFTHYPLVNENYDLFGMPFGMRDTTERNILIKTISESGAKAYLCGHYHTGNTSQYGNFIQYNLRSFGQYGNWYIMTVNETDKSFTIQEY